jgi:hypothetical protein
MKCIVPADATNKQLLNAQLASQTVFHTRRDGSGRASIEVEAITLRILVDGTSGSRLLRASNPS